MSDAYGYGQLQPTDFANETNAIQFVCRQLINRLEVMKLVKVLAVNPGQGSPPAAGTVNVQPLVSQIDYNGYPVPHGTVNGIAYWRFQFGPWAIVADPAVGDVGYVVCADRDSSLALKSPGQISNPGSRRKFSLSDGIYMGGVANPVSKAWFWFKPDGTLQFQDKAGNQLTTSSSGFAWTTASGGDFTVNGISALNHVHLVSGIQTGSGAVESGKPTG
jgi:hypothetical protein